MYTVWFNPVPSSQLALDFEQVWDTCEVLFASVNTLGRGYIIKMYRS